MVHHSEEPIKINFYDHVSEKLDHDYKYFSNIFSELKGIAIQQFMSVHKIERVKELLLYKEVNLTQISYKLNYSDVAHLPNQFKKVTGLSPSHFQRLKDTKLTRIEEIWNSCEMKR